jgi:hypothetical protein
MPSKSSRHTRKRHEPSPDADTLSIPELRRAFEYIESYVHTHKGNVKGLREEWKKVFYKDLPADQAKAYMDFVSSSKGGAASSTRRRTLRRGGAAPIAGAPLDYTTRPGYHITAGVNEGSYALVPKYVDSGFWNPAIAKQYDPVLGQTLYPTRTPEGMGSNEVRGGSCMTNTCGMSGGKAAKTRRSRRALRGGAAALDQAFSRPFSPEVPSSLVNDTHRIWNGQLPASASPSPVDAAFKFKSI